MAGLEQHRSVLEEQEALEAAAAQRFRKNPQLAVLAGLQKEAFGQKRTHRETLLQAHELRYFKERWGILEASSDFGALTKEIEQVSGSSVEKFSHLFDELSKRRQSFEIAQTFAELYEMYSSAPEDAWKIGKKMRVKRKHVLSTGTAHIAGIVDLFTSLESDGRFLDLTLFYETYKIVAGYKGSYPAYVGEFETFEVKENAEYVRYLRSLLQYLTEFRKKALPLEEDQEKADLKSSDQTLDSQDQKAEASANLSVFCDVCHQLFKRSVYESHVNGKKHKKNLHRTIVQPEARMLRSQVKEAIQRLHAIREATIAELLRKASLSVRERLLEAADEDSEYTSLESGSEPESEDEALVKDLPIGPDGAPMPLWLYKLQGLHRSYPCEICGNISYKGRLQYVKHFTAAKHIQGLALLGIPEDEMRRFGHISLIDDATELWAALKKKKKQRAETQESVVEVEDAEGNVMLQKDYAELKRQGLL